MTPPRGRIFALLKPFRGFSAKKYVLDPEKLTPL